MAYGLEAIQERRERRLNEFPRPKLTKRNSTTICQFDIILNYVVQNERGEVEAKSVYVNDYSTFQRVFTGDAILLCEWVNSTIITNPNDPTDPHLRNEHFFPKKFQVGKNFQAQIISNVFGAQFQPAPNDNNFVMENVSDNFTAITTREFPRKDLFRLYIVPPDPTKENAFTEPEFLYITGAENFRTPNGRFIYCQLTFTKLNTELATTGQAIFQTIQRAAPGDGYAWPKLNYQGQVELDPTKLIAFGVSSLQAEIKGLAAFAALYAWGRPIYKWEITQQPLTKIYAPRRLLPFKMLTPVASKITIRQAVNTDYVFLPLAAPTLEQIYNNWKTQRQVSYNPALTNAYEGVLVGNQTEAEIVGTNPLHPTSDIGGKTPQFLWWNNAWRLHIQGFTLNDDNKPVLTNLPRVFNTQSSPFASDWSIDDNDHITQIKKPRVEINPGDYSVAEIMTFNCYFLEKFKNLPLNLTSNTPWTLQDIPIIGSIASRFVLGFNVGWLNSNTRNPAEPLMLFMPKGGVQYGNRLMGNNAASDNDLWVPFELFAGESNFASAQYGGILTISCLVRVQLTDRYAEYIDNTKTLAKVFWTNDDNQLMNYYKIYDLSQTDAVTGEFIWVRNDLINPDHPDAKYRQYFHSGCFPIRPEPFISGYVLDYTNLMAIAKTPYRIVAFAHDNEVIEGQITHAYEVFAQYQKTHAQFTNSIRTWQSNLKTSHIMPNVPKMKYPNDIVFPKPPDASGNVVLRTSGQAVVKGQIWTDPSQIEANTPWNDDTWRGDKYFRWVKEILNPTYKNVSGVNPIFLQQGAEFARQTHFHFYNQRNLSYDSLLIDLHIPTTSNWDPNNAGVSADEKSFVIKFDELPAKPQTREEFVTAYPTVIFHWQRTDGTTYTFRVQTQDLLEKEWHNIKTADYDADITLDLTGMAASTVPHSSAPVRWAPFLDPSISSEMTKWYFGNSIDHTKNPNTQGVIWHWDDTNKQVNFLITIFYGYLSHAFNRSIEGYSNAYSSTGKTQPFFYCDPSTENPNFAREDGRLYEQAHHDRLGVAFQAKITWPLSTDKLLRTELVPAPV